MKLGLDWPEGKSQDKEQVGVVVSSPRHNGTIRAQHYLLREGFYLGVGANFKLAMCQSKSERK